MDFRTIPILPFIPIQHLFSYDFIAYICIIRVLNIILFKIIIVLWKEFVFIQKTFR